MTFRTLTLAFGWNIMLRWTVWNIVQRFISSIYLLNIAIIHPFFSTTLDTQKQNICFWQTAAHRCSYLSRILTAKHNDQLFTKENVCSCPKRSGSREAGRGREDFAAERGAELDDRDFLLRRLDLSWATSPAPASMSGLLGSMLLSMLHANMMLCSITQHHAQQCCEASLYTIKLFWQNIKVF